MIAVPGIYDNGKIILLEQIPHIRRARVMITMLEEWPDETPPSGAAQEPGSWLGSLRHTLTGEIGDMVSPLEETWADW